MFCPRRLQYLWGAMSKVLCESAKNGEHKDLWGSHAVAPQGGLTCRAIPIWSNLGQFGSEMMHSHQIGEQRDKNDERNKNPQIPRVQIVDGPSIVFV